MLVEVKKEVAGKTLQASAHPKLKAHLEGFVERIGEIIVDNLKDKTNVRLGMNVFTVIEKDGIFIITAPNYLGNPRKEITPDLTSSLQIFLEQNHLLKELGLKGEEIMFYDVVLVYDEIWKHEHVKLQKMPIDKSLNATTVSGWVIGRVADKEIDPKKMKKCYVCDLFKLRPALLKTLVLPTNYKAVFKGNDLQAIYDPDDVNII